jgi:hypothetical protein
MKIQAFQYSHISELLKPAMQESIATTDPGRDCRCLVPVPHLRNATQIEVHLPGEVSKRWAFLNSIFCIQCIQLHGLAFDD